MTRREYTDRVVSVLRRLTPAERNSVRAELDGHIEDHMDALLALGYDPALAEERTMAAMGDPEEVGRALEKQYPLGWLILSRIATALLVLCCGAILLSGPSLSRIWDSLEARWDPRGASPGWVDRIEVDTDIRLGAGSDVLYIYGVSTTEKTVPETQNRAEVFYCWYDKNPLGYVSDSGVAFWDCRGEPIHGGAGGTMSAGAHYHDWSGIVRYGDPYITAVVDRYGQRYTAEIPLVWEDGA